MSILICWCHININMYWSCKVLRLSKWVILIWCNFDLYSQHTEITKGVEMKHQLKCNLSTSTMLVCNIPSVTDWHCCHAQITFPLMFTCTKIRLCPFCNLNILGLQVGNVFCIHIVLLCFFIKYLGFYKRYWRKILF